MALTDALDSCRPPCTVQLLMLRQRAHVHAQQQVLVVVIAAACSLTPAHHQYTTTLYSSFVRTIYTLFIISAAAAGHTHNQPPTVHQFHSDLDLCLDTHANPFFVEKNVPFLILHNLHEGSVDKFHNALMYHIRDMNDSSIQK